MSRLSAGSASWWSPTLTHRRVYRARPALLPYELLHTLAVMLLARIDVALRIGRDAAHCEELPGVAATVSEGPDLSERVALEDVHLLVVTVGDEQVSLRAVARQRHIPRRAVRRDDAELSGDGRAERILGHDRFLHEGAVLLEDLYAIAAAIADVDVAVARDLDAGHVAKRFRRRIVGCVRSRGGTGGLLSIREPMSFVCAGIGIEHDDPAIAGVSHEHLVRGGIDGNRRRPIQGRLAVGAVHLAGRSDLQEELTVPRELDHLRIARRRWPRRCGTPSSGWRGRLLGGGRIVRAASASWRRLESGGSDPDVALRINRQTARRLRPLIPRARAAPTRQQRTALIELEDERGSLAADARRGRRQHHPLLVVLERIGTAVDDPDVVLAVDGNAGDRAEHPGLIRERSRPERLHLIFRGTRLRKNSGRKQRQRRRHDEDSPAKAGHDDSPPHHSPSRTAGRLGSPR